MPERFEIYIVYKKRYINTLPFLFPFLLMGRETSSLSFFAFVYSTASIVYHTFYFVSGSGAKYCNQRVCLSLHLSARISQKSHVQISPNVLHMLPVAVARYSSDGKSIRYVLPVLGMTSCFHIFSAALHEHEVVHVDYCAH